MKKKPYHKKKQKKPIPKRKKQSKQLPIAEIRKGERF
jgi:hypothetical protein